MRPSLFLRLLLLIPPFLLLLQLQPAACMPGEANLGWKASSLVESLGNMANELTKDSKDAVFDFKKFLKISGRFTKAASMIGAGFAFVGVLISFIDDSDPKHEELLAEFNKMHGAIENLNLKLDGIKDLIKHEHAMTRLSSHLTALQTIITSYKHHINGEDFGTELIQYHSLNKINDAIIGIYLNAETPAETLYSLTNGNWNSVAKLNIYLQGILFEGIAAYTTACSLYQNSRIVGKENAKNICTKKSELLFNNYTIAFQDKFNQVLDSCIKNYKDNIKKMVAAEHQNLCSKSEGNEAFAKRISKKISNEYFWVDAVVIVYNEVSGYDKHCVSLGDYVEFRTCKKNVVVFMDSKPDYRNPATPRMSNQVVQCSPKKTLQRYLRKLDQADEIYLRKWYHADEYYDNIKEKTGSLFGRLAVIRAGVQMCAEPTDYNGRFFSYDTSHKSPSWKTSIIGQLRDSSFYTLCPSDFPIAYDSGNFCQKRLVEGRGLWSNGWHYPGEIIACPSKPCRDAEQCQDVCNINPRDRVECGWPGISRSLCESKGCCFSPSIQDAKWCFHWKFHKPADMTRYGKTCFNYCRKHDNTNYFWCKTDRVGNSWDYCSKDHKHTIYNEACESNCAKKGYNYYWCKKSNSAWDYCSPGKI